MPPVPIHTKSPINAAKAAGASAETESSASAGQAGREYSTARPGGAAAEPAPTKTVLHPGHVPLRPTRTTALNTGGPASPQPGVVPVAPGPVAKSPVGPPPKAGEHYGGPEPTAGLSVPHHAPPQPAVPVPLVPPSQRGTMTTATVTGPLGGQTGYVGGVVGNQPGHQQNAHAAEPTSYRERALCEAAQDMRGNSRVGGDDDGVWSSAKKWAQAAGEKLSAAENEVWRRFNKE